MITIATQLTSSGFRLSYWMSCNRLNARLNMLPWLVWLKNFMMSASKPHWSELESA